MDEEYPNIPDSKGAALKGKIFFNRYRNAFFVDGTRIRVGYVLGLLALGMSIEQILAETPGLTKGDVEACLLASTGRHSIGERESGPLRADRVEQRITFGNWITLHATYAGKPAVEYLLPVPFMPNEARSRLDPWLAQFLGLEGAHAATILERRWIGLPGPLQDLRDLIMENLPRSLLLHDDSGWIVISRPTTQPAKTSIPVYAEDVQRELDEWMQRNMSSPAAMIQEVLNPPPSSPMAKLLSASPVEWVAPTPPNHFLIPPPPPRALVENHLKNWPFHSQHVLREFFCSFLGLKDIFPDYSAEFYLPSTTLHDLWGDYLREEYRSHWSIAMPIFSTCCGDALLLHPQGELGWFLHETGEIGSVFEDFEDFLNTFYLPYKKRYDGPLEAFGRD